MRIVVSVVALLAVLFLFGRRMPARRWPVVIAITLVIVLLIVMAESYGVWPHSWHVQ